MSTPTSTTMSTTVQPIPAGYHTATPYLIIKDAARAIEFYQAAFGASEILRLESADGKIGHAEIKIGDSPIMRAEEHPEFGFSGPLSLGGSPVGIMLYVEDVDAMFARAIDAGGKELKPLCDQFYGDRTGTLTDPFGHVWTIATHQEDVSTEEIQRRFKEAMQ